MADKIYEKKDLNLYCRMTGEKKHKTELRCLFSVAYLKTVILGKL